MDAFMGTVQSFAFPFAPNGWQLCRGQIMSISQSSAMFALLGITYGGDGQTTFGLPDLSGRAVVGSGTLRGGATYSPGEFAGQENMTLRDDNMPRHRHGLVVSTKAATTPTPGPGVILATPNGATSTGDGVTVNLYAPAGDPAALSPDSVGLSGMSQPFSLRSPYLVLSYCIALKGAFPSRN